VNCISGTRLIGAPIFIFLFVDRGAQFAVTSMILLLVMLLTDILDGSLARRWNVTSAFGYVLDGVADRSTNIALIVALTALGKLSPLLSFFLLLRDVMLYAARALFAEWWSANRPFRSRVRISAAVFYLLLTGLAVTTCGEKLGWPTPEIIAIQRSIVFGVWAFALWSYVLLAGQIRAYSGTSSGRPS
jgi:phosphatidylglycerophosphate synthase